MPWELRSLKTWIQSFIYSGDFDLDFDISVIIEKCEYLLSIDYIELLLNYSVIYYIVVFFLLSRVLLYFGITIITLINTKHSISFKKINNKSQLLTYLKFNNISFRCKTLKLIIINCL